MGGKRDFFTGSTAIIGDPRPSGLDMRVYACISEHDGMSLKKGTGRGCYATYATLTGRLGCDASNLSKSIKRLVEWGYITEERQKDRRLKTFRVVFDFPEGWRNDQRLVGENANDQSSEIDGELANGLTEIVGNDNSRNRRNSLLASQHYSSLKELDSSEEEKLDPSEEARLAARRSARVGFAENVGAQMAMLERRLKAGQPVDRVGWYKYLSELGDIDEHSGRAARLSEELCEMMTQEEFDSCVVF
jgi:hypothetical protein